MIFSALLMAISKNLTVTGLGPFLPGLGSVESRRRYRTPGTAPRLAPFAYTWKKIPFVRNSPKASNWSKFFSGGIMKLFYSDEDLEKNKNKRKAIKDTLTELRDSIPWPRFLPILQKVFRGKSPKAPGGRPAYPLN